MMKKIMSILLGVLAIMVLAACARQSTSTEWMEGDWYSEDWKVTYTLKEAEGKWSIRSGNELVGEGMTLSQKGKLYTLTDKEGVSRVIEQKSETEIYYQQVAPEGVLGTTERVPFKKVVK